jgi:hypothetical protein
MRIVIFPPQPRNVLPQEQVHARGDGADDEHEDVGEDHQPAGPQVELDVQGLLMLPQGSMFLLVDTGRNGPFIEPG